MRLTDAVRSITTLLTGRKLFEKVNIVSESRECAALLLRRGSETYLAAIASANDVIYAKIVPSDAVPAHAWSCNGIFYTPYGIYVFAHTPEELVEGIKAKERLLRIQLKLVEEALKAGALG